MKIRFLGTGTSHGIPVIGCRCAVCTSSDPRDERLRASVLVESGSVRVLIDAGPEFRIQALRAGITRLDAVLLTHSHADHLHGLDDVRPLTRDAALSVYASADSVAEVKDRFAYIFNPRQTGGGLPDIRLETLQDDESFTVSGVSITPLPAFHGRIPVMGYRIGSFAYLTDVSSIPASTLERMQGLEVLVLGALRHRSHPTHFTIAEACDVIRVLKPETAYLTHICHEVSHAGLCSELPVGVFPAYDGLDLILSDD